MEPGATPKDGDGQEKQGKEKTNEVKEKRPSKKPKIASENEEHTPPIITKPKETLLQFALSAQKLVRPRMK